MRIPPHRLRARWSYLLEIVMILLPPHGPLQMAQGVPGLNVSKKLSASRAARWVLPEALQDGTVT